MTRITAASTVAFAALVLSSTALAGGIYAGPKDWVPGEGASTTYETGWLANAFGMAYSGSERLVTFIDNRRYKWHYTVRGTQSWIETYPPFSDGVTKYKAYCRALTFLRGSCFYR